MSHSTPSHLQLERQEADKRTVFGFWVYLMTDCVLFASLFATYAVLHASTYGGPGPRELFNLPDVLTETLVLLASSFTCGVAMLAARRQDKAQTVLWFLATLLLGLFFLSMELTEFGRLVSDGNGWQRSGFLSAFFTLVGTHGLHITAGSVWIVILLVELLRRGFSSDLLRKLTCLSLFWHFLDVIWIFIFTVVYLMGVLQ